MKFDRNSLNENKNSTTRRSFIQTAGAASAALALPQLITNRKGYGQNPALPEKPNLILIMTDQQRYPRHWPEGWAQQNLPNWNRLTSNGITFSRGYCNTAMCTPSRATLLTGLYPAQHKVVDTIAETDTFTYNYLPLDMQNMGRMLGSAGYHVSYFGKWHLSKGETTYDPTPEDLAAYGFNDWTPPEAGQDTQPKNYASRHDQNYVNNAIDFLSKQTAESTAKQPFAAVISLVNPHDVLAYPGDYENDYPGIDGLDLGISLPPTLDEDLSTKPSVQKKYLQATTALLKPLLTNEKKKTYVNFYAYLQKVVDAQLEQIFAVMEKNQLIDNTVVFRVADHGEMGLSHNGMRQKAFVAYEETLNVPIIVSNPLLFPKPVQSESLASLIDVMPTMAALAKVPNPEQYVFRGVDLTPVFSDPSKSVQDTILFTFDDQRAGSTSTAEPVPQPNHIQCIVKKGWKYARYYDPSGVAASEYEMYDLVNDPTEIKNLAGNASYSQQEIELRAKLDQVVSERLAPIDSSSVMHWQSL